jgi:hypothetical protein
VGRVAPRDRSPCHWVRSGPHGWVAQATLPPPGPSRRRGLGQPNLHGQGRHRTIFNSSGPIRSHNCDWNTRASHKSHDAAHGELSSAPPDPPPPHGPSSRTRRLTRLRQLRIPNPDGRDGRWKKNSTAGPTCSVARAFFCNGSTPSHATFNISAIHRR